MPVCRLLRLDRGGSDGSLDGALLNDHHATAATAVAAIAAVATAVATPTTVAAVAAAIAPAAAVAATMATITAVAAIAAVAAVAAAAIAAAAEQQAEGLGLVLTADEGDADQGEKDRHTEHNDAIHPQILQLLTGTSKRERQSCRHNCPSSLPDGQQPDAAYLRIT